MEKAKIIYDQDTGQPTGIQRGPLNKTDKHWGKRSNMKFRKKLMKGK